MAGNADQILSTWFHLPSFWLADSLCNAFSAPFGISVPTCKVWTFSVRLHGVTYLMVINYIFTYLNFNVVCFHVCRVMSVCLSVCLGTGWFSTLHRSSWSLPDVVPCFCPSFLVHMLCGSCTKGICHFSYGVDILIFTNFVGKWMMAFWKLILSAWNLIRWWLISHWNLYGYVDWFCLLDIRFVDDHFFNIPYMMSSVHLYVVFLQLYWSYAHNSNTSQSLTLNAQIIIFHHFLPSLHSLYPRKTWSALQE